jgi:hypothetical protein
MSSSGSSSRSSDSRSSSKSSSSGSSHGTKRGRSSHSSSSSRRKSRKKPRKDVEAVDLAATVAVPAPARGPTPAPPSAPLSVQLRPNPLNNPPTPPSNATTRSQVSLDIYLKNMGVDVRATQSTISKASESNPNGRAPPKEQKKKKHKSRKEQGSTTTTVKQRIDKYPGHSFSLHPNKTEHSNHLLCVACNVAVLNDKAVVERYKQYSSCLPTLPPTDSFQDISASTNALVKGRPRTHFGAATTRRSSNPIMRPSNLSWSSSKR